MNLKNNKIVKGIAAGVLALGVSALIVTATLAAHQDETGERWQPRSGRMHRGFGGFDGLALRQLDLTDAQREQVRSIFEQNRDEMRAAGEKLRTARRGLYDATSAGTVDEAAIRTAAEALANAEAEAAINRARVHAQVWQILTPEQQAKAKELRQQREARRKERRQGQKGEADL
ncbi:MAG TPA: Spy/CpxP family protein refolding chaperone [Vicinamibacterales bacterium]|jgi:protein CpxP|nr:Spy/CpxP family protein refolding chaperone [Vicinamibacterales bacterium]